MRLIATLFFVLVWGAVDTDAIAQTPPSEAEIADYGQLHAAAHRNDVQVIQKLSAAGALLETRDKAGRTPIHVAAHAKAYEAIDALVKAGGDINALEEDSYDAITIAAVAADLKMVKLALSLGGNPKAITSRYDGTALIAAAHLGHAEVVGR